MSETFYWIVGGTTTNLSDNSICKIIEYTGLGMPSVRRIEERGPLQNGVTDRGFRFDPRVIMLNLSFYDDTEDGFHGKRTSLINMFKPRNTAGILRFVRGSTTRQINGHIVGGLEFPDSGRNYLLQRTPIALKCPDPRWYDPELKTTTFALGGGDDTFVVPFEVPFTVGASTIDITRTVTYNGSVKAYLTIRITGPITDPVITHNQTGYKLDFTGTTIAAADYYEIDLGYSQNTIVDSDGTNVIDDITTDSDLIEFAIEADPDVPDGVNSINVTGSSISSATEIMISYYEYYLGI